MNTNFKVQRMLGLTLPNTLKKYRAYFAYEYVIKVQRMVGLTLPTNLTYIRLTLPMNT